MLTIEAIREAVAPLAAEYGVERVELFGSYADGRATEASDADFLASFGEKVPSIFKVMGFQEELGERLSLPVDVVTAPIRKPKKIRIGKTVKLYERL